LQRTAAGLGLDVPPLDELRRAVDATIDANQPGVGRVRLTLTGGVGPSGTVRGDGPATVLVVTGPAPTWDPVSRVVTVPWTRNERGALAGLKTTSYAENVVALARAHEAGADEAVFANTAGNLCEGTGTNVFVVIDSRVVTPPLSSGCLAGVTRDLLLEHLDVGIVEADVPMPTFVDCDEAFVTSSTRDVQPIATIDGRALARVPGPQTQAVCDAFARLQSSNPDP